MRKDRTGFFLLLVISLVATMIGIRFIYYGSIFRNCIYTEQIIPIGSSFINGKIFFIGNVSIIQEPYIEYKCLPSFKTVSNQLIPTRLGNKRDDGSAIELLKIRNVTSGSDIELYPVQLVAVEKHGISTIDSGGGPLIYLILKDTQGALYQIPTVYLGTNKGEEILKIQKIDPNVEEVLSADSKLTDL